MDWITDLFSFIARCVQNLFLDKAAAFAGLKVLLTSLFVTVIPAVLNNVLFSFMEMMQTMINEHSTGETYDGLIQLTGLLAWFVDCLKISDCVTVLVSAYILHITLKMIPFSPFR